MGPTCQFKMRKGYYHRSTNSDSFPFLRSTNTRASWPILFFPLQILKIFFLLPKLPPWLCWNISQHSISFPLHKTPDFSLIHSNLWPIRNLMQARVPRQQDRGRSAPSATRISDLWWSSFSASPPVVMSFTSSGSSLPFSDWIAIKYNVVFMCYILIKSMVD